MTYYKSENFESGSTSGWQAATGTVITPGFAGAYAYRMASAAGTSELNLFQTQLGSDKLYWSVRFRFRLPSLATGNPSVLRVQNTNAITGGGGGHADIFVDYTNSLIKGDLQPTDTFTGPALTTNQWYLLESIGGFKADDTSFMTVKLDGTQIGSITSTLTTSGDKIRNVRFGSPVALDATVDVDDIMIAVSPTDLTFAPGLASGMEVQGNLNRLAGTSGLGEAGAANTWAATTDLELQGALNAKAGTSGLASQACANKIAGTSDLAIAGALDSIPSP